MATKFQIVFDCSDPNRMAHFWSEALGYRIAPPPAGYESGRAFFLSKGVPEDEAGEGDDRISDPAGAGPTIWFQQVSERKAVKNRVHIDLAVSGGFSVPIAARKERVDAAADRLAKLGATVVGPLEEPGVDHYAVAMRDPEGNEFEVHPDISGVLG